MGIESSAFGLGNTSEEVRNPITSFNFVLEVEGVYFLPLKSVRAFTKENEYEYIKEGGVNDYVHMKRKPISKPFTFQVERYVGTERFLDPLANGTELILPLILHVYRHAAMRGFTALPDASPARLYTFTGCTVISKEYGELNSERSGILTEVTTIAYRELMVVTNCFTSTEKDKWSGSQGAKVKFATQSENDKTPGIYKKDAKGFLNRIDDAEVNKPAWTGAEGTNTKYVVKVADGDKPDTFPYMMRNVGELYTLAKKDGDPFYKPFWTGKNGAEVAYAVQQPADKNDMFPYEKGDIGDLKGTWVMKDKQSFKKLPWDGQTYGTKNAHAKSQTNDVPSKFPYEKGNVGNTKNTWIMKDGMSYKKPQYEFSVDKDKLKYAQEAFLDKNSKSPIYKKNEDGSLVRIDNEKINKPAWSGKVGAKTYAEQSGPDKADDTYMYGADGEFMRVDNKPYNKAPWDGDYGSIPIWATMAKTDEAGGTYSRGEDGYLTRIDNASNNKAAWKGEYGADTLHAKSQPNDKEEGGLYTRGDVGEVKNTLIMKEGSGFSKPQYELKKDMTTNKYAKVSPTDSERAPQVIWPPTRRALMADTLSKK